ncbi:MAG: hypothetical protein AAF296_00130 [Pseudomonadota bacterium]
MKRAVACLILLVSACSEASQRAEKPDINPADFVLLPCNVLNETAPCTLAIVGGKRLLFGAPAGLGAAVAPEDLRQLDGVFLFSLRAADIEGLDEVRNASWHAGRERSLNVTGPDGTQNLIAGLNLAFETADALRVVDHGIPKGGFDAAILTMMPTSDGEDRIVFNTGDVVISAMPRADQAIKYTVIYQGATPIDIQPCLEDDCRLAETLQWPLKKPEFIVRASP